MNILDSLNSLYDGTVNFLVSPVKQDIPAWKIGVGLILLFIVAFWIVDNSNVITKALKQGVESL